MKKQGKVYIVGAGPGDPGLITLKALHCLQEADVVIYDHLVDSEILSFAGESARLIYTGGRETDHTYPQEDINTLLLKEAREGNIVVRLMAGDPFIFSRGGEEAEVLAKAGLSFEVVPGVTAAVAAPAYAGIPLTHSNHSSTVAFISGCEDPKKERSNIDWHGIAGVGTLVFLKGVKNLPGIVANLTANGKDPATPAALIRGGTTPDQETLVSTLRDIVGDLDRKPFPSPAILVVGSVVGLRGQLNWFEAKPLFGKGVVITRPKEHAEEMARLLSAEGAKVIYFPTIKIVPTVDWQKLDRAIGDIEAYQWLVFTSANGAKFFLKRLREQGRDIRDLKGIRICTIGPATAGVIEERGLRVDLIPESFIGEGVVRAFRDRGVSGQRILLPRAEVARDVVPDGLASLGAEVEVVTVYRTVSSGMEKTALEASILKGEVDVITFTSPSTVEHFMKIMGTDFILPSNIRTACIGPVTARAVEKAGMKIDIMRDRYTIPGLVEAMVDYFENPPLPPFAKGG